MSESTPVEAKVVLVRRASSSMAAFFVSLIVHLIAVLTLSLIVIGTHGDGIQGIRLIGNDASENADDVLEQFEIGSEQAIDTVENTNPETLVIEPSEWEANSEITLDAIAGATPQPSTSSSYFSEASVAVLTGGAADAEAGDGGGSRSGSPTGMGATFFGTRAEGHRFVFVIDSSTSMIGPRWDALRIELSRALRSLSPDQEFFVISFDFEAHPMFGQIPPKGKFLTATAANIEKLNRWVGAIQHRGNTLPASAIGIGLRLQPDAIFLLSDGEIRDSTVYDLRQFNRQTSEEGKTQVLIPIHTVLLHSDAGYLTLKNIADENDGVFTPVSLHRLQQ